MSQSKRLYILQVEAKDSFQLAKHLLSISKQINDGTTDGTVPCYWEYAERKR